MSKLNKIEKCDKGGEGVVISLKERVQEVFNKEPYFKDDEKIKNTPEYQIAEMENNLKRNLISNDITRCKNFECSVKEECSMFLQIRIDTIINAVDTSNFYYAEFTNIPAYTIDNPQESYDARKNCDKFIQYEIN